MAQHTTITMLFLGYMHVSGNSWAYWTKRSAPRIQNTYVLFQVKFDLRNLVNFDLT